MLDSHPIQTLSDLAFHVREHWLGRPRFLGTFRRSRSRFTSSGDFIDSVYSLALALRTRGLVPDDRVAIFADNGPETLIVEFACHLLRLITVPIPPQAPAPHVAYQLKNSGCGWVFFGGEGQASLLVEMASGMTKALSLVDFEDAARPNTISMTVLLGEGASQRTSVPIEHLRGQVRAHNHATLLYTDGTTGTPKGALLTHRHWVSSMLAALDVVALGPNDQILSFLSPAHYLDRVLSHLALYTGASVYMATLNSNAPEILATSRPTVILGSPSQFEKLHHMLIERWLQHSSRTRSAGGQTRQTKRLQRALRIGTESLEAQREGTWSLTLPLKHMTANALVFKKWRRALGGRLQSTLLTHSRLASDTQDWLSLMGAPAVALYGLAECPLVAAGRIGHAGAILDDHGHEDHSRKDPSSAHADLCTVRRLKVQIARGGEILLKGSAVMSSYWKEPGLTAKAVDDAGWLHTQDLGRPSAEGSFQLAGRVPQQLTLTDGRILSPHQVELILEQYKLVHQAVIFGHNRPYPVALLVPNQQELKRRFSGQAPGSVHPPGLENLVSQIVSGVNAKLPKSQRLRRWVLLERDFTAEQGERTPRGRLRRRVIGQNFAQQLANLYGDAVTEADNSDSP